MGDVKFYPQGMDTLLRKREGEVGSHMYARGLRLQALAKAGAPKESGRLAASIYLDFREGPRYPSIIVGSRLKHAYLVHEGTRPHAVRPEAPGRVLRFNVNGRIVYATKVNHPGQKPNRFLTRHMRSAFR